MIWSLIGTIGLMALSWAAKGTDRAIFYTGGIIAFTVLATGEEIIKAIREGRKP